MRATKTLTVRLRSLLRVKSKAQILLIAMVLLSALLGAAFLTAKSAMSERAMAELYLQREKAFYIAEAGIEDAKVIISKQPNWFTDTPHSPDDDINWIKNSAKGETQDLINGTYKIVREGGKNIIYAVGSTKGSIMILKARIDINTGKTSDLNIL